MTFKQIKTHVTLNKDSLLLTGKWSNACPLNRVSKLYTCILKLFSFATQTNSLCLKMVQTVFLEGLNLDKPSNTYISNWFKFLYALVVEGLMEYSIVLMSSLVNKSRYYYYLLLWTIEVIWLVLATYTWP